MLAKPEFRSIKIHRDELFAFRRAVRNLAQPRMISSIADGRTASFSSTSGPRALLLFLHRFAYTLIQSVVVRSKSRRNSDLADSSTFLRDAGMFLPARLI